ncbi:MAG TPA: hypothetical protein VES66_05930 [Terriglobales bacterium]|nr:hypothetical protein [Terriglobales bacterium]
MTTPERRRRGRRLVLLSLVLLAAAAAWASEKRAERPYALIFGTVYAPDNRPAYGVRVKIRRADQKKAHWELYSDHQGEFAQRVPAGAADYIVCAEPEDKHAPRAEAKVHVQNDERVDVGLHLTK